MSAAVEELCEDSVLEEAEIDAVLETVLESWLVVDAEVSPGTELDGGGEVVSAAVVELEDGATLSLLNVVELAAVELVGAMEVEELEGDATSVLEEVSESWLVVDKDVSSGTELVALITLEALFVVLEDADSILEAASDSWLVVNLVGSADTELMVEFVVLEALFAVLEVGVNSVLEVTSDSRLVVDLVISGIELEESVVLDPLAAAPEDDVDRVLEAGSDC